MPGRRTSLRTLALLTIAACALVFLQFEVASAQFAERLGRAATNAAEAEARRQVHRGVRAAIRCAIRDQLCQDRARREGREVILVDERGNPVGAGFATWGLTLGTEDWSGDQGRVIEDQVFLTLQLVTEDDLALYLFLREDREGEQGAAAVFLGTEGGSSCQYPYEGSAPFVVRLDQVDSRTVAGAFEGMVRCDDSASSVRLRGTFRITR